MLPRAWILSALIGLAVSTSRAETEPENRNAVFIAPMTMLIAGTSLEFPVVSMSYERLLGRGYSLYLPVHGGYYDSEGEEGIWAVGFGGGLRKYIGRPFSGSYFTLQYDQILSNQEADDWDWDSDGSVDESLAFVQLSYGYKFQWLQFALDLGIGGAFYITESEKYTRPITAVNVGFPFSSKTFGF